MALETGNQAERMQQLALMMGVKNFDPTVLIKTEFFPDCLHNLSSQQCRAVCEALSSPANASYVNKKGSVGGYTALHWMCIKNELDLIEHLLTKCGADINSTASLGESSLFICIKNCNLYTIELVIKHGADLSHRDIYNRSLVHWCAYTGKVILLYYFEKYHSICNFNELDQFKQNALHIACACGFSDLIIFLIKRGDIDYYLQDFNGNTCLHMAAKCGLARICWMITKQNNGKCAKLIGIMNNQNQTPFDMIRNEHGLQYKKIRDWLRLEAKTNKFLLKNSAEDKYPRTSLLKIKKGTFFFNWNDNFKMNLDWYSRMFAVFLIFNIPFLINTFVIYPNEMSLLKGLVGYSSLFLLVYVMVRQRHRCTHISGYQNPFHVGLLFAMFLNNYSTFYFYLENYENMYSLVELAKLILSFYQNLVFYRILRSDPGICRESYKKSDGTLYELRDLMIINAEDPKGGKDSIEWLTDPPIFAPTVEKPMPLPQLFFCESCLIVQAVPTRHCKLCECCISKFDHHCLFIGKCVGLKNHRNFVLLIVLSMCCLGDFVWVFLTYCQLYSELLMKENRDKKYEDRIDLIYVLFSSAPHIWCTVLAITSTFIILMLLFLLMLQIRYVTLGYTTQIRPPAFFVQSHRRMQSSLSALIYRLENLFIFLFDSCESNLELYFKQQSEYNQTIMSKHSPIAMGYEAYPRDNFNKNSNTQSLLPKENPNNHYEIELD